MATGKRLIDANALINEINQQRRASRTSFPRRSYVVGDVLTSIYNAPTVDAVEVVRCKDCKHCKEYKNRFDPMYTRLMCVRRESYAEGVDEDDFCSYGEKRSDND